MKKVERIYEIDAFRGIAAICVLLFHFELFRFGCTGVDLFFVISGFVIFMSLESRSDIKKFIRSRVVRLYPSYWLSIVIAVICAATFFGTHLNIYSTLANFTMLQPLFRTTNLVGAYWTLYVELLFYTCMILLASMQLFSKAEILIFVSLLLCFIINLFHLLLNHKIELYDHYFVFLRYVFPLISHLQTFSAGIIFYIIYQKGFNKSRVLLLLFTLICAAAAHRDSVMINSFLTIEEHVFCLLIYYILFILLIQKKIEFLKFKPFILIGTISYPLYLTHQPTGVDFWQYLKINQFPVYISKICGITACIVIAVLITFCFDIPVRKHLKGRRTESTGF